ncbi:uncharacterized protein LOC126701059 [Quercus robur]|uniref:uncharacterized protein LOC126701059 n=1 Tax=Quercus robur TaxID=38942 RepID=UPI0021619F78|nr:uncharacterized protein LOC126701059 [Quercus robur]
MSKALDQLSKSPFTHHIERDVLPRQFQQSNFAIYNGRTDPMEHVSQFNQRMTVHFRNEALMCKVFPSSLGPVAMRWFNGLKTNSINSYRQLTQAFGSRFVTNRRAPRPSSALLSLSMHDEETLKAYSDRYWETYNKMEDNFDDVAIITFKNSLLADYGLRKSLIGKSANSMHQLMDRIDKYKRVEEDQLQGRGKEKLGKNIEIYVDDMVVKSKVVSEHLRDLGNTFGILRKQKLRLNASKCSFGIGSGKFLGYMVTHRGIEVNPDQIKAINDLKSPQM